MADNIWKCTCKKSWDVTKKLVWLAAEYVMGAAIVVILAVVAYGLFLVGETIRGVVSPYGFAVINAAIGVAILIPLWVWGIIAIVAAIPTYSFLWCVDQDIPMALKDRVRVEYQDAICKLVTVVVAVVIGVLAFVFILIDMLNRGYPHTNANMFLGLVLDITLATIVGLVGAVPGMFVARPLTTTFDNEKYGHTAILNVPCTFLVSLYLMYVMGEKE